MTRIVQLAALANAIIAIIAVISALEAYDPWRGQNPLTANEMPMDVALGTFVLLPLAILATVALNRFFRFERTLPNQLTVFAAVFGTLTAFYFLWRL
jgi:hypothetical protein